MASSTFRQTGRHTSRRIHARLKAGGGVPAAAAAARCHTGTQEATLTKGALKANPLTLQPKKQTRVTKKSQESIQELLTKAVLDYTL